MKIILHSSLPLTHLNYDFVCFIALLIYIRRWLWPFSELAHSSRERRGEKIMIMILKTDARFFSSFKMRKFVEFENNFYCKQVSKQTSHNGSYYNKDLSYLKSSFDVAALSKHTFCVLYVRYERIFKKSAFLQTHEALLQATESEWVSEREEINVDVENHKFQRLVHFADFSLNKTKIIKKNKHKMLELCTAVVVRITSTVNGFLHHICFYR